MTDKKPNLTKEQLLEARTWLNAPDSNIPPDIKFCLLQILETTLKGEKSAHSAVKGFHELLVMMGFKASSEKIKNPPAHKEIPSKQQVEALEGKSKRGVLIAISARALFNKNNPEAENCVFIECKERDSEAITRLERLGEIEDEEERLKAQELDILERLSLGNGKEAKLESPVETLFPSGPLPALNERLNFTLDEESLEEVMGPSPRSLRKEMIQTTRYDFSLQLRQFDVSFETAKDTNNGRSLSALPSTLGPRGFQVTWRALINITLLTVGFLVPMHRLQQMLGNVKIFHRSNLARYLGFVSERALPVYFQLAKELSNADILWADATPTRVNEVNKAFEAKESFIKSGVEGPHEPFPWENAFEKPEENNLKEPEVGDPAKPEETDPEKKEPEIVIPIWKKISDKFGYAFENKSKKSSKPKTRHQTMVIHGRSDTDLTSSHIVFFRSCLGDVGNVLDNILKTRNALKKSLILQCDHSSANLPSAKTQTKMDLKVAGCLAHARRPFKKHFNQDPERCDDILSLMYHVTRMEERLKETGKNTENTTSLRRSWGAYFLEYVQFRMQEYSRLKTWSDQTPLGKAARHFIKHFEKLTIFLTVPGLEATNNMSERLLRPEKLSQASSYFRDTMEGRARFDILRTLHQTCSCAGIPFSYYLLHLLLEPELNVERHPEIWPRSPSRQCYDFVKIVMPL